MRLCLPSPRVTLVAIYPLLGNNTRAVEKTLSTSLQGLRFYWRMHVTMHELSLSSSDSQGYNDPAGHLSNPHRTATVPVIPHGAYGLPSFNASCVGTGSQLATRGVSL
ncbi:hypothetical protein EDD16DRAFT_1077231 [Pisolithus croceorrhizus]|nr:hypothetical protein EDD16DRAFT_1077231 [Pisolithus croceorrhizus]